MSKQRPSGFRRVVLASGAALIVATSALGTGAYSYLKPVAAPSSAVTAVPLTTMSVEQTGPDADASNATVYEIQSSASTASFIVDEVLRGSPYTVVGTTNQVAGQFAFDASDPTSAQIGTILIDARTLVTDDQSRTRALGNAILDTNQYEYIEFTPTEITGLPESLTPGQPFTFQATGDLTIKDTTRPVTFDISVTPAADGSVDGTATATISYADWGVSIPSVPFVASVDQDVVLKLDFSASATA